MISRCPQIEVPVIVTDKALLPFYQTFGASGMDLYAAENTVLDGSMPTLVPTGLKVQLPEGYEFQIRSRSGWASRDGVIVYNQPGTIDSDYRGEIKVLLWAPKCTIIRKGWRIAQLILAPVYHCVWRMTDALENTKRGEGGFGGTGHD